MPLGGDRLTFRVSIRLRRTEYGGGDGASARSVYCPIRATTVAVSRCLACERLIADEGVSLLCRDLERPEPPPQSTVADVMAKVVVCVDSDVPLEELRALLDRQHLDAVPVVEDEG